MFTNVLKKFFTAQRKNENKEATQLAVKGAQYGEGDQDCD
jgi:hypothetical protein